MIPITSYFQRKPRKENVSPQKRKQNATDDALQRSSKKSKLDAPTRHQLSNRTRSLNKEGFSVAASTPTNHSGTISRTSPQHQYATPKSLARTSTFRKNGYSNAIADLAVELSEPDTEANPFLIRSPKLITTQSTPMCISLPPTPNSSIQSSNPRTFLSTSHRSIVTTTPKRPFKHVLEIVPETPESPTLRPPKVSNDRPDLFQLASSRNQEAKVDILVNRKCPSLTSELHDLSQVSTSQSQELEIDFSVTGATTDESPNLSQVPTSQSQEVEVDLSMYRSPDDHPPSDEVVPCSQSQDLDGIFLEVVSPRRRRVLHELEQARQIASATDTTNSDSYFNERQSNFVSKPLNEPESGTDYAANAATIDAEDITLCSARDAISEQSVQCSNSHLAVVSINDEDIQNLFESEGLLGDDDAVSIANGCDTTRVELPATLPSQASSITESDSGDEQWMLRTRKIFHNQIVDAPPPMRESDDEASPRELARLPLTQSEIQSWQTDVSAYSYPPAALDFLDMLEEGPD
ncbi:hypothetical protein J3R30DRAFT_3523827 [Lentinula aciculospora]|uniref:Uncharacterized protein n=1 Tax=Lentinula aciculospora TaxID=153920 RepID=A0A9W9DII0_9AGAR|nr:hypothetical protein J3R30DRAFT_3523827 [Lentinula aciculospora]